MAARTLALVASLTWGELLITRDTVPTPTPAALATSKMVATVGPLDLEALP